MSQREGVCLAKLIQVNASLGYGRVSQNGTDTSVGVKHVNGCVALQGATRD
jgi:hypothetical protein